MMNLAIRRIESAKIAAMSAKNSWFKNYWNEVANELERKYLG